MPLRKWMACDTHWVGKHYPTPNWQQHLKISPDPAQNGLVSIGSEMTQPTCNPIEFYLFFFSLANGARSHSKHWICTRKEENRPYIHVRKITLNGSFGKVTREVYLSIGHDINGWTWNLTALCSAKPAYRTNKRCCVERGHPALRSFEGKKGLSLAMRENKREMEPIIHSPRENILVYSQGKGITKHGQ